MKKCRQICIPSFLLPFNFENNLAPSPPSALKLLGALPGLPAVVVPVGGGEGPEAVVGQRVPAQVTAVVTHHQEVAPLQKEKKNISR